MSNVATNSQAPRSGNLGVATISGRISHGSRRITTSNGTRYLTVIRFAAPDEFSTPDTVEVRSVQPLGQAGQVWTGDVRIGGYGRRFDGDGPNGQPTKIQSANVTLDAL